MSMPSLESFDAYVAALGKHDWFYEYSDDHSVWRHGRDQRRALQAEASHSPWHKKAWDVFYGRTQGQTTPVDRRINSLRKALSAAQVEEIISTAKRNKPMEEIKPKEFKLIVAGGRDFDDYPRLEATLFNVAEHQLSGYAVSIVSGMARGADALAHRFAKEQGVVCYEFPANWNAFGKRAGFLRNEEMAKFADGLLFFWDGQSKGTAHMINSATKRGLQLFECRY